jgi:surface polysaccharide O-acyltransferase-like enzyme
MQRRHDIDALRVFAFALLILYHAAMVYVADWDFHLKSSYQAEWLQWPMIAVNRWRMPLLFMISGMAIGLARVEGRRLAFAATRSLRLLLPLIFGMFVVVAVQAYCEGRANGHVAPGLAAFFLRYWQVRPWPPGSFSGWEYGITWNHLWYLAYLLPYTLFLLLAMPWLRRAGAALAGTARRPLVMTALWCLPVFWLLLVLLAIAPHYPETHSFMGDWTVHAESLPLFLLGYLLADNAWFWTWLARIRWTTFAVAMLGLVIELGLRWLGRHPPAEPLPEWASQVPWYAIERCGRALYTWSALLAIFGWGRVWLDRPFRWLPYCTEAVFPWYVLHQTLIIALAYHLVPLHLGPITEAALVVGGTIAGCLLLHEFVIRRSGVLRPLFGLKRRTAVKSEDALARTLAVGDDQLDGIATAIGVRFHAKSDAHARWRR